MIIQPNVPPPATSEPLRFACHHCGGNLEVPGALAGVTGPCPLCGEMTTAPRRENRVAGIGAAHLFAKPPPRREMPPPLAPLTDARAMTAPVPLPGEAGARSVNANEGATVFPSPASANEVARVFPVPVPAKETAPVLPMAAAPVKETVPVFPVPVPAKETAPVFPRAEPAKETTPVFPRAEPAKETTPVFPIAAPALETAHVFPVPEVVVAKAPVFPPQGAAVTTAPVFPVSAPAKAVVPGPLSSPLGSAEEEEEPISAEIPRPVETITQPPSRRRRPGGDERGIFGETTGGGGHLLDIRPNIPFKGRHGWRRWVDIGIVSVFTGLLLATVAAVRYTEPLQDKAAPGLPPNLTQLVERETQNQVVRGLEAAELACAAVNRYLGAASEQAAASHLLPPPDGMAPPAFPPFVSPPSQWSAFSTRRIPLTDRYLVAVQPQGAEGPVFVVEQTDGGPRLHAGPITQQSAKLFEKFVATPGQGEATLYVEVRPTVPAYERDYRAGRPDLDSYLFVDVQSAFPSEAKPFIACFKPDSEAAKHHARHGAHDLNWRRALVQVRWQIHREAGPWVELVKFIPGPWSGDPPASLPTTTASAAPPAISPP